MWRALTTNFIAPPKLEPLSSVPSVTATGISLLLHAASPVCPEMGEMGTGGAGATIVALLRSRHACCAAADESSPLRRLWVGLPAPRGQTDTGLAPFPVTRSVSPPAPHSSLAVGEIQCPPRSPRGGAPSMLDLGHRRRSTRSRCTSWERGRRVLGQTREGWREGGEKGGRDEGCGGRRRR